MAGEKIISRKSLSNGLYFILDGDVSIQYKNYGTTLKYMGVSDDFGDEALVKKRSHFNYVCLSDALCLHIPLTKLQELQERYRGEFEFLKSRAKMRERQLIIKKTRANILKSYILKQMINANAGPLKDLFKAFKNEPPSGEVIVSRLNDHHIETTLLNDRSEVAGLLKPNKLEHSKNDSISIKPNAVIPASLAGIQEQRNTDVKRHQQLEAATNDIDDVSNWLVGNERKNSQATRPRASDGPVSLELLLPDVKNFEDVILSPKEPNNPSFNPSKFSNSTFAVHTKPKPSLQLNSYPISKKPPMITPQRSNPVTPNRLSRGLTLGAVYKEFNSEDYVHTVKDIGQPLLTYLKLMGADTESQAAFLRTNNHDIEKQEEIMERHSKITEKLNLSLTIQEEEPTQHSNGTAKINLAKEKIRDLVLSLHNRQEIKSNKNYSHKPSKAGGLFSAVASKQLSFIAMNKEDMDNSLDEDSDESSTEEDKTKLKASAVKGVFGKSKLGIFLKGMKQLKENTKKAQFILAEVDQQDLGDDSSDEVKDVTVRFKAEEAKEYNICKEASLLTVEVGNTRQK
jgi:hypothetical protein